MSYAVRPTVLIADKHDESRSTLASAFERAGYAAAECSSLADALSRLDGLRL